MRARLVARLKRLIPPAVEQRFRRWASRKPWRASLYYLWNGAFRREHQAVLCGVLANMQAEGTPAREARRFRLRRCIHRLEKGLIMRPRKKVYALDYIRETVALVEAMHREAASSCPGDRPLVEWAHGVLRLYFEGVGAHPTVDAARERYAKLVPHEATRSEGFQPHAAHLEPPTISYDDLLRLAKRRRSVRWYLPKPVPREIIDKAIEVARWSPSGCNRQPFQFRVFDEPELTRKVGRIPMGAVGFCEQVPCIVVLVGQMHAFESERDRHLIYIDAALAAMAFQFALEVQGVGSCCLNWPDMPERERAMRDVLRLGPTERPVMLMFLGFPDPEGMVTPSPRKPLAEIRVYNQA